MRSSLCPLLLACLLLVCWPVSGGRRKPSQRRSNETCVEMSRPMQEGMIRFPRLQAFLLNVTTKDVEGVRLQSEVMTTATHMGTHMDAPRHFNATGLSIDQIPIRKFNGVPAQVVDVRNKTVEDPGYQIEVSDLEDWERDQNTSIGNGSLVLLLTGWGERWPDAKRFLGTDQDDPDQLRFPGLSPLAATWLAQRDIVGVGTECVSIDPSGESTKGAHRTLLNSPHGMYVLENLANVDQLPAKGARIRAFPMMIAGASGAPARVLTCFRQKSPSSSSSSSSSSSGGAAGRSSSRRARRRQS